MRFISRLAGLALLQVALALAVPVTNISFGATPLPPTEGPFYTPPTRLDNVNPGTILRSRSIGELSFQGVVPFTAKASYQLMF